MTKQSILLGVASLVLAGAVIAPQAILAYKGDAGVRGPNYTPERHAAMQKAFETKDFNAWKRLANKQGRVSQVVTAENFARFAEAHELAEDGKVEEANKIRSELGLGNQNGSGMGMGRGMHNGQGRGNR